MKNMTLITLCLQHERIDWLLEELRKVPWGLQLKIVQQTRSTVSDDWGQKPDSSSDKSTENSTTTKNSTANSNK